GDGGDDGRRHGTPPLAPDAGLDDRLLLQRARRSALPLRRSLPGHLRAQGHADPRTRAAPIRHLTARPPQGLLVDPPPSRGPSVLRCSFEPELAKQRAVPPCSPMRMLSWREP